MNASIVRWSKTHTLITSILVLCIAVFVVLWQTVIHTVAQSTPSCPPNYLVTVPTGSQTPGTPVAGIVSLLFNAPSSGTTITAQKVTYYSNSQGFLGNAVRTNTTTNGTTWSMPLVTQLLPNGVQSVYASVQLSNNTICNSVASTATVLNPTGIAVQLAVTSNPASFNGPTNTVVNFAAVSKVPQANIDVTTYSDIQWATTTGNIEKQLVAGTARLFTGPLAQNGKVTITVKYGGRTVNLPVVISILGSTTDTSGTTSTTTTSTAAAPTPTTTTTVQTATLQSNTTTAQQTALATTVQDCAAIALGAQKAADIKAGIIRPTTADLEKLKSCFAQVNYVVPNTFAPVAPAKVKDLEKSPVTKIVDLSNVKTESEKDALKISGVAKASSSVMVYVFSEPLVITTSTDSQGNWSYTLEDPLEPGNHEIYAVVDKGDGQYQKTDPFSFVIGRASASAENPSGLSLKLENDPTPVQSNRNVYVYLGVFGALLVTGLLFTLWLFRRWNNHNNLPPPSGPTTTFNSPNPPITPGFSG